MESKSQTLFMPSFRLRKETGSADFQTKFKEQKHEEVHLLFCRRHEKHDRTIDVEDKWYYILQEMDEAERKGKYNYDRHNKSASLFDYEGDAFVDDKADPFENLMREKQREQLDAAIASLTDCQRELFEMVYIERRKVIDVAEAQQVSQQAITDRLCRIKKKLQKFLADTLV